MKGNNSNNNKIVHPWDCGSEYNIEGGDLLSGFPWPPRSYTCSFCKREFRSAQALGGHMNVHRRDRARLRQSPPRDGQYTLLNLNVESNPNLIFNPNPSFSSSSPSSSPLTKFPPFTSTLPSSLSPPLSTISSPSSASATELRRLEKNEVLCNHRLSMTSAELTKKTTKALLGMEDLGSLKCEEGCTIMKNAEIVTLDLEIGLFSEIKQDLDLELRLGYT